MAKAENEMLELSKSRAEQGGKMREDYDRNKK